jgi:hypothetical protein
MIGMVNVNIKVKGVNMSLIKMSSYAKELELALNSIADLDEYLEWVASMTEWSVKNKVPWEIQTIPSKYDLYTGEAIEYKDVLYTVFPSRCYCMQGWVITHSVGSDKLLRQLRKRVQKCQDENTPLYITNSACIVPFSSDYNGGTHLAGFRIFIK